MAIKVHGFIYSPAVQRVLISLAEKDLDYEFINVNLLKGEQKHPSFISLNPFGQVPVFEDDDFKLFESRAITKYIAYTYAEKGSPLLPTGPKELAIMWVWSEVETGRFDVVAQKLNYEIIVKPIKGLTTDEAIVDELTAQLAKVLDVYENHLSESKYLAGNDYTLVDLHHVPLVNSLMHTKVKALFEERPHVSAWSADILARPASQKVFAKIHV